MTSEIDVFRTANVLIREHGEDAAMEAAQRADAMLEKGSVDGQRMWRRVLAAVKEIQRQEPREGEAEATPWAAPLQQAVSAQAAWAGSWEPRFGCLLAASPRMGCHLAGEAGWRAEALLMQVGV
jgi:hypothetical protein